VRTRWQRQGTAYRQEYHKRRSDAAGRGKAADGGVSVTAHGPISMPDSSPRATGCVPAHARKGAKPFAFKQLEVSWAHPSRASACDSCGGRFACPTRCAGNTARPFAASVSGSARPRAGGFLGPVETLLPILPDDTAQSPRVFRGVAHAQRGDRPRQLGASQTRARIGELRSGA